MTVAIQRHINDRFYLQTKNDIPIKSLRIFDRWGGLIFDASEGGATNQASNGWDGYKNGQKMPEGVYVWEAELLYGKVVRRTSGSVLLVE